MRVFGIYAKCDKRDNGTDYDIEQAKTLSDELYEVVDIYMGQSYTSIKLRGASGTFNSVNFSFYIKRGGSYELYDIFSDPSINPYL